MRFALTLLVLVTAAVPAFGQTCCCSNGSSGQSCSLAALKLVSTAGDTVDLSQHLGKMPMALLLAGTDSASAQAADAFRDAAAAAGDNGPMFTVVLAAGAMSAKAFAKAHNLAGLILIDPGHKAQKASMADTLPIALFIDKACSVVKATASINKTTIATGLKALAPTEEKPVDPVCGMAVTRDKAAATYDYQGKTYYFCSTACRDNFTKDPQKYLAK